jgi:replicative DNA helicase
MSSVADMLAQNEALLLGTIIGVTSRDEDRGWGLAGQAAELRAVDFRDPRHQQGWQALLDLLIRGSAPNAANIYAEVGSRAGEDVARYVTELRIGGVDTDDVSETVALVRLASRLRRRFRLAQGVSDIINEAQRGTKPLWEADRDSAALLEQLSASDQPIAVSSSAGEALTTLESTIEAQKERGRSLTGVSCGVGVLDDLIGGWQPGALHLVGSVTGVGKTTFAIQSALAAARADVRVLLVSLEMDEGAIIRRMATSYARASYGSLVRMSEELRATATAGLGTLPLRIVARFALTAGDVAGIARREAAREGVGMIVVDHVQMLGWAGDPRVPRFKQIGDSTWRLIDLANSLKVPLVMTAQLNAPPPTKGGDRAEPSADDIRESKEPFHACSCFVVVHQKRSEGRPTGDAWLLVQKNRFGPIDRVEVDYDPAAGTFADVFQRPPARDVSEPDQSRFDM